MSDKAQFKGARQLLLKDVHLQYTKVARTVMYQGEEQWETSIVTDDPKVAQDWEFNHLNVRGVPKLAPTSWTVSLKRKKFTKDGTENEPVRVVHADKSKFSQEDLRRIGNNSVANIIIWQGEYDNKWGQGVTSSLTAIQVTKLVPYEGGMTEVDFDTFGEEGDAAIAQNSDGSEADIF